MYSCLGPGFPRYFLIDHVCLNKLLFVLIRYKGGGKMKVVLNLENDYVTIEIELFRTYNPMVTTHGDRATAIWEK